MAQIKLGDLLPVIRGEFQIYSIKFDSSNALVETLLASSLGDFNPIKMLCDRAVRKIYPDPYGNGTAIELDD